MPDLNIGQFLEECASTAYPEPESQLHSQLSKVAFDYFFANIYKGPGATNNVRPAVLDVGCGSGFMYDHFKESGWQWIGTTLDKAARDLFREKHTGAALNICINDMHDPVGASGGYDLIWARHVLEHSPIPFFVLDKFSKRLKPGGYMYIEVPAPNTGSFHAFNPNHYSCFDMNGWTGLITKAGFTIMDYKEFTFEIAPPDRDKYTDMYYCFYLQKPE